MDIILIVLNIGAVFMVVYLFVWGFINLVTANEESTKVEDYEDTDWWEDVA